MQDFSKTSNGNKCRTSWEKNLNFECSNLITQCFKQIYYQSYFSWKKSRGKKWEAFLNRAKIETHKHRKLKRYHSASLSTGKEIFFVFRKHEPKVKQIQFFHHVNMRWLWLWNSIPAHHLNPLKTNTPQHIVTSQFICIANQLTSFYMMRNIGR